jgi:6-phosphogluconolactonase (cycloisomerase 2 family)
VHRFCYRPVKKQYRLPVYSGQVNQKIIAMKPQLITTVWALLLSLFFTACQKNTKELPLNKESQAEEFESASAGGNNHNSWNSPGHVYTISNDADGNEVLDYRRAANGTLTFEASYSAGGNGSGGGLGNQGAVVFADENEVLLAVNAGSNSVSSFKIKNNGLQLRSTVNSGGMRPVSIAVHEDIVYVLNAGGNGTISGFRLLNNDKLQPIPNSTRPLSVAATTGPAQISFVRGGRVLVITEKATNTITTYTVNEWGVPGARHTITSSSPTPFGFATGRLGNIFVSEAAGGAPGASVLSSYRVHHNGSIALVDGSVGAGQSAACWVVITNNGKFAYVTNTNSNNITTFGVNVFNGNINISEAISATTEAGPIDAALSRNSRFLYVLNGAAHSIQGFAVAANGSLSPVQTVSGLPAAANGLAAR